MARFEITYIELSHKLTSQRVNNKTDLVDIHVTLRSTASLEYDQWELVDQLSGDDLGTCRYQSTTSNVLGKRDNHVVRSPLYSLPNLGVHSISNIDHRSGLL